MLNSKEKNLLISRIREVNPNSLNQYLSESVFYENNMAQLRMLAEKLKSNKSLKPNDTSFSSQVNADFFKTCTEALITEQSKNAEELERFKQAHPRKGLFASSQQRAALKQKTDEVDKNIDKLISKIEKFNYGQFKYVIAQMYKQSAGLDAHTPSQAHIYVPTATEQNTLNLFVELRQSGIKFLEDSDLEDKIYRDFNEYRKILEETETEKSRDPVSQIFRNDGMRGRIVDKGELISKSREEKTQNLSENEQISGLNSYLDQLDAFLDNSALGDAPQSAEAKKQIFSHIKNVQDCQLQASRAVKTATDPNLAKEYEEVLKKISLVQKKFETNKLTAQIYSFKQAIDQAEHFVTQSGKDITRANMSWDELDKVYADASQVTTQMQGFLEDEFYQPFSKVTAAYLNSLSGVLQKCNDAKLEKTYNFIKTAKADLINGCSDKALSSIKRISERLTELVQDLPPDTQVQKRVQDYLETLKKISESCDAKLSPAANDASSSKAGIGPNDVPSQPGD